MGDQLHGAPFVVCAWIHVFQHIPCDFRLMMIVQSLVHAGHRFDVSGNGQKIVTDDDYGDVLIEFSKQLEKLRLAFRVDAGRRFV